jgi:hypothetical protein
MPKDKKVKKEGSYIHICMSSDMHPYNCDGMFGGECEHCERAITKYHHPKDCALCDPEYDFAPNKYWKKKKLPPNKKSK